MRLVEKAPILLGLLIVLSGKAFAYNNQSQILNLQSCGGCHGGGQSPTLPAAQGFEVVDSMTNLPVNSYEFGRTYFLKIHLNNPSGGPNWRNAYVLTISDVTSGSPMRAGSIVSNVGLTSNNGPTAPEYNTRIIDSTVKATADNMQISWQAPSASATVRFQLIRMEAKRNG